MYNKILVTLDATPTDRAIIEHVKQLARLMHSRVVLLHVADGWAARTYGPDAVSPEIDGGHGVPGEGPGRVPVGGHRGRGRAGLRRPGQGDRAVGAKRRAATWSP